MDTFGKRLRYARQQQRLTQQQLADRVGLSREAIAMLETGKTQGTARLMEIAKTLRISPGWLLWGNEKLDEVTPAVLQAAVDLQSLPTETRAAILALIASNKQNSTTD